MWHERSVGALARSLRSRELAPLTLFRHFWQRIENGPRNVWTLLDRDHAQDQALSSQRRWETGQLLGPLDGIPIAIKDVIDVAGQPTSAASITRRHAPVARQHAPVVQRLCEQGAVLIGKTNLSEFAFSGLGINPHFGTPTVDAGEGALAPGGSSSGSAMALVHGMVPLALGTDTSGSVRIPCAWNGLVGFRPSAGRYPEGGVFPLAPALDVVGPMARNVQDLAWLDAAMAGDTPAADGEFRDGGRKPRLWVAEGPWLQELDVVVERAFETALSALQAQGWIVVREPHLTLDAAMEVQAREGMLVSAQAAQVHAGLLRDPKALALLHGPVRERLLQAHTLPAGAEERLLRAREALRAQWQHSMNAHTLVVMPTTPGIAPKLAPLQSDDAAFGRANLRALRNTFPSSFLDAPSITLPLASRWARPNQEPGIGLQLSAASGQDRMLLASAAVIESALRKGLTA